MTSECEGIARLRRLCAGQPMGLVVWRRKNGLGKPVRITRRVGCRVWLQLAALGAFPPRGMSSPHSVDEVIRDWEPVPKMKANP
jgi:hypothetical protein